MDKPGEAMNDLNNSKTILPTHSKIKGITILGSGFDRFLEGMAILGLVTTLGSTLFQVCARYVFSSPVTWSEELSRFAFIWLTFIAAAIAVRKGEMMVSVDSLINLTPRWAQKAAELLSSGLVALVAVILVVFGWQVCKGITSLSLAMGWPVKLFYAAPLVGGIFVLVNLVRTQSEGHTPVLNGFLLALALDGPFQFHSQALMILAEMIIRQPPKQILREFEGTLP